jgi:acetyl esterase/lipase
MDLWTVLPVSVVLPVIIVIRWLFHITLPAGCSQPWKLYLLMASRQILRIIGLCIMYILGHEAAIKIIRYFENQGSPKSDDNVKVSECTFDGVSVWIYEPRKDIAQGTGIMFIPGGGWALKNPSNYDHVTREFCRVLGAVVVSVNYRKVPEYKFPVPLEDCEAAYKYFVHHSQDYGVDSKRIALAGDSAGGNLVAALVLKLRDEKFEVQPSLQVLIYPALQSILTDTPSYNKNDSSAIVLKSIFVRLALLYIKGYYTKELCNAILENKHTTEDIKQTYNSSYLNIAKLPKQFVPNDYCQNKNITPSQSDGKVWNIIKTEFLNPYVAPLLADDLRNLPPTYVMTMEEDMLRDDGLLYVERLKQADNQVTHAHHWNAIHDMILDFQVLDDAQVIMNDMLSYMKKRL